MTRPFCPSLRSIGECATRRAPSMWENGPSGIDIRQLAARVVD
jgi:hypothetical protein